MDAVNWRWSGKCCGLLLALLFSGLAGFCVADDKPAAKKEIKAEDDKTPGVKKVILQGLTLKVPAAWTQKDLKEGSMRLGEFEITPVDGDHEPTEFYVFQFGPRGGGSFDDNRSRWIGQFEKTGTKVTSAEGAVKGGKYQLVDITGNYKKSIGPPVQRQFEVKKGWRVINVRLDGDAGVFFLKLQGPQKTVDSIADNFRKSFGGDATKEKELRLEAPSKE